MSIDARIKYVNRNDDGSGRLELIDRPPHRTGSYEGCRGQKSLHFDTSPIDVTSLQGSNIWGNDGVIMLGEKMIATRISYTKIKFVPDDQFADATEAYRGD